jgi:hypothetical protein
MPRKKKEVAEEAEEKKTRKTEAAGTKADQGDELLPKIQCFNANKKLICANLKLDGHKCDVKSFAHGRPATVRIGKKRRCEMYEETAYTA